MREIKFEYIFKEKYGMNLHHRMFTIEDLENYEMDVFLLENSFEIVARRQSTNLKDKNGKEVYEGDVVTWKQASGGILSPDEHAYTCQIKWDHISWVCEDIKPIKDDYHSRFTLSSSHIEVIGNIYESPELIKTT